MRVQLRIIAGTLRGRKITCHVSPALRPTPEMVREALFSILGNAIPDRPFFDVFAGTGVIGLEALSRGALSATFIERDFPLAQNLQHLLREFQKLDRGQVVRTDAYRWAGTWLAPDVPVNVFLSPPFADFDHRVGDFLSLVETLWQKLAPGSVLVIQSERHKVLDRLPDLEQWEERRYGRNVLLFWVKAPASGDVKEPMHNLAETP
jgi:16S rRNA (guanine(966)-N(2))-methyltransferase RsmD